MDERIAWVFLAYRLPREPSTPRITVWRKLKRLGVAQLLDGLVALPLDARNREQLEWIAQEITQSGGTATLWRASSLTARQEREVVGGMQEVTAAEYDQIIAEARNAPVDPVARRRAVKRLRGELRRIRQRDYFPPPNREEAKQAVDALAAEVEAAR
ncbi:MAG TPA: Chromate resistance protein ChrB [Actinomycetota bacterium]|nr:Chromate resistance protein ChrB [Actinomycetota bacterium]